MYCAWGCGSSAEGECVSFSGFCLPLSYILCLASGINQECTPIVLENLHHGTIIVLE